jgi:hypothetical protein
MNLKQNSSSFFALLILTLTVSACGASTAAPGRGANLNLSNDVVENPNPATGVSDAPALDASKSDSQSTVSQGTLKKTGVAVSITSAPATSGVATASTSSADGAQKTIDLAAARSATQAAMAIAAAVSGMPMVPMSLDLPAVVKDANQMPPPRGGMLKIKRNSEDQIPSDADDASPNAIIQKMFGDVDMIQRVKTIQTLLNVDCMSPKERQIQWYCTNGPSCGFTLNVVCLERPLDNGVAKAGVRLSIPGGTNHADGTYHYELNDIKTTKIKMTDAADSMLFD